MAITKPTDTTFIRPNEGALIVRMTVGTGGVAAGDVVANGTDGVTKCDGNGTAANHIPVGVAIQTATATNKVDVVILGRVSGFTDGTIGKLVYPDDTTAGSPSETASTNKHAIGFMETASVLFVQPRYVA
jgi:hypothetical protein